MPLWNDYEGFFCKIAFNQQVTAVSKLSDKILVRNYMKRIEEQFFSAWKSFAWDYGFNKKNIHLSFISLNEIIITRRVVTTESGF